MAVRHPLAEGGKVGRHTELLLRPSVCISETSNGFVKHKQRTMQPCQSLNLFETAVLRIRHVHWLEDYSGELSGMIFKDLLQ
jgi:hypothetical protein